MNFLYKQMKIYSMNSNIEQKSGSSYPDYMTLIRRSVVSTHQTLVMDGKNK